MARTKEPGRGNAKAAPIDVFVSTRSPAAHLTAMARRLGLLNQTRPEPIDLTEPAAAHPSAGTSWSHDFPSFIQKAGMAD
jgi:hypothetical protein